MPANPTVGLVYYTDNKCKDYITDIVRRNIKYCCPNLEIISVSLKPINFGKNIVLPLERGGLTMFKQQITGLEASTADIVYMVEHDILYHPSHFNFIPPRDDIYYYNQNQWRVHEATGMALFYWTKNVSDLCAHRSLLVDHYKKRVERTEQIGFKRNNGMGYEPGCSRLLKATDKHGVECRMSEVPNIDIRHSRNFTVNRWRQDEYRCKDSIQGWNLTDSVPGWGKTKDRFQEFIKDFDNYLTSKGY